MNQFEYRPNYRRHLPHMQPPGASIFVTGRLAGSLPQEVIQRLTAAAEARARDIKATPVQADVNQLLYQEQKRHLSRIDNYLDWEDWPYSWRR